MSSTTTKTIDTNEIIYAYTDGACITNKRLGGWGFVLKRGDKHLKRAGGTKDTTNNQMEMTAVIKALEELRGRYPDNPITIYSDSEYVIKGVNEWLDNWKRNGWRTANKKPVKNTDLWKQIDSLNNELNVSWEWVRGHNGNVYNEEADRLAREATPRA